MLEVQESSFCTQHTSRLHNRYIAQKQAKVKDTAAQSGAAAGRCCPIAWWRPPGGMSPQLPPGQATSSGLAGNRAAGSASMRQACKARRQLSPLLSCASPRSCASHSAVPRPRQQSRRRPGSQCLHFSIVFIYFKRPWRVSWPVRIAVFRAIL